jgi:hypothetical protein
MSGRSRDKRILIFGMCPPSRNVIREDKQHHGGKGIQGEQFHLVSNGRMIKKFDSKYPLKDSTTKSSKHRSERSHLRKV